MRSPCAPRAACRAPQALAIKQSKQLTQPSAAPPGAASPAAAPKGKKKGKGKASKAVAAAADADEAERPLGSDAAAASAVAVYARAALHLALSGVLLPAPEGGDEEREDEEEEGGEEAAEAATQRALQAAVAALADAQELCEQVRRWQVWSAGWKSLQGSAFWARCRAASSPPVGWTGVSLGVLLQVLEACMPSVEGGAEGEAEAAEAEARRALAALRFCGDVLGVLSDSQSLHMLDLSQGNCTRQVRGARPALSVFGASSRRGAPGVAPLSVSVCQRDERRRDGEGASGERGVASRVLACCCAVLCCACERRCSGCAGWAGWWCRRPALWYCTPAAAQGARRAPGAAPATWRRWARRCRLTLWPSSRVSCPLIALAVPAPCFRCFGTEVQPAV